VALSRGGDIPSAISCFDRCISIDANEPVPYRNAADFRAYYGQFEGLRSPWVGSYIDIHMTAVFRYGGS
jgi:hypothetical protein